MSKPSCASCRPTTRCIGCSLGGKRQGALNASRYRYLKQEQVQRPFDAELLDELTKYARQEVDGFLEESYE
jgi:hypothetical protein